MRGVALTTTVLAAAFGQSLLGANISVSPSSLVFQATVGGANPAAQSVSISATSTYRDWTAVTSASWIRLSASKGRAPSQVQVSVVAAGLAAGTYSGQVTFTAKGSKAILQVTLNLLPPPAIQLSPSSFSFTAAAGAPAASQNLTIANSGGGLLNWSAASNPAWLSVQPASGTAPSTPAVVANAGSLQPGSYSGLITISATGASNTPQTVAVSLTVTPPPAIQLSPSSLTFTLVSGAPASSQNLSITNSGGGTLNWSAASNAAWLSVQPASGTAPSTPAVVANAGSLQPGSYSGLITISATGASNTPQTVAVSLTVTAPPGDLQLSPGTLSFLLGAGGASASQNFSVGYTGTSSLAWTASASAAWLTVQPASGSTPGSSVATANQAGLQPGAYSAAISVAAPGASNTPQNIAVNLTVTALLTVTTTSLPLGSSGTAYSTALSAVGGAPPYTWKLDSGQLPPGLTLQSQGVLAGVPAGGGIFSFGVQVTDSAAPPQTTFASFTLGVFGDGPTVLWSADHETGDISQWYIPSTGPVGDYGGGLYLTGTAGSAASQEQARAGGWGLKMTITTPPESAARMFRWREPRTFPALYYSVWYFFPQRYSVGLYWNVLQWKSLRPAGANDPFFILNVGNRSNGAMYFYLYNWQSGQEFTQSVKNIPAGQWFKVDAFYQCAGDGTGRVAIWQDDTLLFDLPNVQTRYADGDCQWSVNNYSNGVSPTPAVIYIDDAAIVQK